MIKLTNNYCGISLLSTTYNILSNILLSLLSPYIDEIIGDHQCGIRHNRSTTAQIFCIQQILEKSGGTMRYSAYDSLMTEVLYNVLVEFEIAMKLVRLIKMCLNETYSEVHIGKHLSDSLLIQNGSKQGDALSPSLLNFALEHVLRKVQEYQMGLKLNGTHQLLAHADYMILLGYNIAAINKNTDTLVDASKVGLEVIVEKTKYMLVSHDQNENQNWISK
jgi:hypothetical protein